VSVAEDVSISFFEALVFAHHIRDGLFQKGDNSQAPTNKKQENNCENK
jgi:hypothetical protein